MKKKVLSVTKFGSLILLLMVMLILSSCSGDEKEYDNRVAMPFASSDLNNENYEKIVQQLKDAGFTNIKIIKIDDLVFGFLTKDGEVEAVTIDGKESFSKGDKFDKEVKMTVSYHTFPEKESEEVVEETEEELEKPEEEPTEPTETPTQEVEDEILTVENNEDLAALLAVKDPLDPSVKEFVMKYAGRTIEFDGNIAYMDKHGNYDTRYDILIYVGDYSETEFPGPLFQFNDVNMFDLHLTGDNIPDYIGMGLNLHIVAKLGDFNENSGLYKLEPVSIRVR